MCSSDLRAARCGLADYCSDRDLRRLVKAPLAAEAAVPQLMAAERRLEQTRRNGDASYSVAHHIEVLIALMAEIRLLPRKAAC